MIVLEINKIKYVQVCVSEFHLPSSFPWINCAVDLALSNLTDHHGTNVAENNFVRFLTGRFKADFLSWQKSVAYSTNIRQFLCYHHYRLVQNFQLICYSQRVNATRHNAMTVVVEDVQSGRTIGLLQWRNIAGSLYKEEEAAEKDDQRLLLDRCSRKHFNVQ